MHLKRGIEQSLDFMLRIYVRLRTRRLVRQQSVGRDLRSRVACAAVARKHADKTQPPRPLGRSSRWGLGPTESQFVANVGRFALLHERRKIQQSGAVFAQFESQTATQ